MLVVIGGVSGAGKSTIGKLLSERLAVPFHDADQFHSRSNVEKMASGIPLDDDDRQPWLETLAAKLADWQQEGGAVLACSALKQTYRDLLLDGNPSTLFIYLKGEFGLIMSRMQARAGHYMKPEMLNSQFDTLEEPTDALTVDIGQNLDRITEEIITKLQLR